MQVAYLRTIIELIKVAALKAYNSVYKYDFLCISETFLNSSFESNDKDLMIERYNLI